MKNIIISGVILLMSILNLQAQWNLVGKTTTGSQFELSTIGTPLFSIDSTQIFFPNGRYFATFDIRTKTLTNVEKDFLFGNGGEGILIDHKRNRFLCIMGGELRAYDYYTHELIDKKSISISGTGEAGLIIDKKKDELIIVYRGYDSAGAISILNLDDFTKKNEFYTKYEVGGLRQVVLDEKRSHLFLFYAEPDGFDVFSLDSYQYIYSAELPEYYISPLALLDSKYDRIILCDYLENYKNILINLKDYSLTYLEINYHENQLQIDTISDRLWDSYSGGPAGENILVRDLSTLEVLDTADCPQNYHLYYPFSCPKFNYLYALGGNYLLIFDLTTFNYLGKVRVGSSPSDIAVDYLKNGFFIQESSLELMYFNDFKLNEIPAYIKEFEITDLPGHGLSGFDIIPERNEIIYLNNFNVVSFNYSENRFINFPLGEIHSMEVDHKNQRIYVLANYIRMVNPCQIFVLDFDLNLLWDMVVPRVYGDLDYDGEKYLYYMTTNSTYNPGGNLIYKIDTEQKEIVDSIEIGYYLTKIEYSKEYKKLYALNRHDSPGGYSQEGFPGRLYLIDCNNMECIDSTDIPGARLGFLAESIETMFIFADGGKLLSYNIRLDSLVSEQYMPDGMSPSAINLNPVTNTLYIVDQIIGGIYKYRNDTLPGPPPPAIPAPPILNVGDNQIIVRWNKNDTIASYNLYRKTAGEDWMCVSFEPIVDTFFKDLNLINNIEYSYALSYLSKYYIEGEKSAAESGIPIDMPDFEISRVYSDNICSNDGKFAIFTFSVQKEATFDKNIIFSFENIPEGISTSSNLIVNQEDIITIKFRSYGTVKGDYTVTLVAAGGGQTHKLNFTLQVVDVINITIDYYPEEPKTGDWISIEGSTFPFKSESVVLNILTSDKSSFEQDTVLSDENGIFKTEYTALMSDTIFICASLVNYDYESDTLSVYIRPGDVNVSCVADVTDSTGIGWYVQVTGMVFPNPKSGTVRLQITSPFNSEQFVDNIPLNEFGYYGHTFKPYTSGLWKINAYYSGNENYAAASSYTNFVPIGIKSGYAIILVGDVSSESQSLDSTFRNLGKYVYNVLLDRHISKEDIYFLYPDENEDLDGDGKIDDVDGNPNLNSIDAAFQWARINISDGIDLTLYIVSKGDSGNIQLNSSEYLTIENLHMRISNFSLFRNQSKINIIAENSFGTNYINKLANPLRRILVSTNDSVNYFFNYGDISFSGYFWSNISAGKSVGESFIQTKSILNSFPDLFFGQECLADANNNMLPNEQEDFDLLTDLYIGYGTMINNFAPEISGSNIDTEIDQSGVKKKKSGFTLKETQENNLYISVLIKSAIKNLETVYAILINNESQKNFLLKSFNQIPEYKVYELSKYGDSDYYIAKVDEFFEIGNYTFIVYAENDLGIKAYPEYCQFSIIEIGENLNAIKDEIPDMGININVFPNPFNSHFTLEYKLIERSEIMIKLYNETGRLVDIIDHGKKDHGIHSVDYSSQKLIPGIYFISFELKNKGSGIVRRVICIR